MARRYLPWVVVLSASLHVVGVARSILPAQDGLKFLRFARQFHSRPWADVVRDCDQHPLYPACIALAQPAVGILLGPGPDSWRIAAQVISVLGALATIFPLYRITRSLFDERTALMATILWVLLPMPAEIGHETLSDALALCTFSYALWLGEIALRTRRPREAIGCGLAAGLGYWARPEVGVVPMAVVLVAGLRAMPLMVRRPNRAVSRESAHLGAPTLVGARARPIAALCVAFLGMVGSYALVKGEVSEKLALRRGGAIASRHDSPRKAAHPLPPGLDDPRWDFSAKEESGHPVRLRPGEALRRIVSDWAEGLGWAFAPLTIRGLCRVRARRAGRWLLGTYALLFGALLIRHAMTLGYLSSRHLLTLTWVSVPWAAAGALDLLDRFSRRRRWDETTSRRSRLVLLAGVVAAGVALQLAKPGHPSRWGHWAAGRWLTEHAEGGEAVLDTRGWAAFVSQRPSYDYWHVRQALTDSRLAFVVVGSDELSATSRRAATLRALLAYAAEPVASFPGRSGGAGADVRVFRFRRPASWEGLCP